MQPSQPMQGPMAPSYTGAPPAQWTQQAPPPMPSGGGSNVGKVLGAIAIALAIVAMAVNFVIPGPTGVAGAKGDTGLTGQTGAVGPTGVTGGTGATGPAGPQGPPGQNGTDGAQGPAGPVGPQGPPGADGPQGPAGPAGPGTLMGSSVVSTTQAITGTCSQYSGAEVTLTVPGPGTVVVTANPIIVLPHNAGTRNAVRVFLDTTSAVCTSDGYYAWTEVRGGLPGPEDYVAQLTPQKPFAIASAGTYAFYLNGILYDTGPASFYRGSIVAVFYPS